MKKVQVLCRSNITVFSCQILCQNHSRNGEVCIIFLVFFDNSPPPICDKKQSKIKRPPKDKLAKHVFDTLGVDKTWLTILKWFSAAWKSGNVLV